MRRASGAAADTEPLPSGTATSTAAPRRVVFASDDVGGFGRYHDLYGSGTTVSRIGERFSASVVGHRFPRLLVFDRRVAGAVHHRDLGRVRGDGFAHINLQVLRSGTMAAGAPDREQAMAPGDVVVFDTAQPQRTLVERADYVSVAINRDAVAAAIPDIERLHGAVLPAAAAGMLSDFVLALGRNAETLSPALAARSASVAGEFLAGVVDIRAVGTGERDPLSETLMLHRWRAEAHIDAHSWRSPARRRQDRGGARPVAEHALRRLRAGPRRGAPHPGAPCRAAPRAARRSARNPDRRRSGFRAGLHRREPLQPRLQGRLRPFAQRSPPAGPPRRGAATGARAARRVGDVVGRHRVTATQTAARPQGDRPALSRRQLAAVTFGNGLEFYEFSVYAFFAVPIGRTFFPVADPWASLLLSVSTFGIGYLTRPLGALAIGAVADFRGARLALSLTVVLMGLATLVVAVLPGYVTLGLAAPCLIVAARLAQGFALGAETGPAIAYLAEATARPRRARAVAWQVGTNGAALLSAGLVGYGLSLALPRSALEVWGWRLAFALALATMPAAAMIRARLPDVDAATRRLAPFCSLLIRPGRLAAGVLIIASGTVSFSISAFMTSYALTALHLGPDLAFLSAVVLGAATVAMAPIGGLLADRYGRRSTFLTARAALALAAVPAFAWLEVTRNGSVLLAVSAAIAALSTLGAPAGLCLVSESLPAGTRSTGLALVYALGISLFGGTTQVAVTALVAWSGDLLWPGYYLAFACGVGAAAAFGLPLEARGG